MRKLAKLVVDQDGVTALEYALITALIAAVIIVAMTQLGGNINSELNNLASTITNH